MLNPKDQAELVYVPAGDFVMGSSEDDVRQLWQRYGWDEKLLQPHVYDTGELHPHRVTLDGLWIYRDPVTIGQYFRFMQETRYPAPVDPAIHDARNSAWQDGKPLPTAENLPVSSTSWNDAVAYCKWANARLPTEAEWEFAARGANGHIFPWGNDWDRKFCRCGDEIAGKDFHTLAEWQEWLNGSTRTRAELPQTCWLANHVAQIEGPTVIDAYPEDISWCGVRGMAGQVREWCSDWYDPTYYPHSPSHNPIGPDYPSEGLIPCRILRGGSWLSYALTSRGAQRLFYLPDSRDTNDHGFRPVMTHSVGNQANK